MDSILAQEGTRAGARNNLQEWQIRRVLEYVEAPIDSRTLVSDLSRITQRSEAHFTRAFKGTFGETPHAYLTRLRLEVASRAMLASNAPLTDIALTCGFADQAHLCRLFRRWIGRTPAAWRRDAYQRWGVGI